MNELEIQKLRTMRNLCEAENMLRNAVSAMHNLGLMRSAACIDLVRLSGEIDNAIERVAVESPGSQPATRNTPTPNEVSP